MLAATSSASGSSADRKRAGDYEPETPHYKVHTALTLHQTDLSSVSYDRSVTAP